MFAGIKLRTKLILGFSMVLLLFLATVWVYQGAVTSSARSFHNLMAQEVEISNSAWSIGSTMLQCRRDEDDFLMRKDKKYSENFVSDFRSLKQAAEALERLGRESSNEEVAAKARDITGYAREYEEAFKELVASWEDRGLSYKSGLEGKFVQCARNVEEKFSGLGVMECTVLLLQLRRDEKNYLLRGEEQYIRATHEGIEKLLEAVGKTALPSETRSGIENILNAYKASFDALVAEDVKIAALTQKLRDIVARIEPLTGELQDWASRSSMAKRKITEDQAAFKSRAAAIIAAGVLLASLLLICLITRGITGPVNRVAAALDEGAEQIAKVSGQVSTSARELADGASKQAAAIEEASSSLEEMSSMTRQNADHAVLADTLMKQVREVVSRAGVSMTELTRSMGEISKAGLSTQKIVKTIDEIAFQTNLLALNAAVEAARAGDAGAGFAVVADEVRNLAMRSAEAAKNTANLIEDTVTKVKMGSELVAKTEGDFHEVAASVDKSGELVGEISAASNEQSTGIEQINQAVSEMDRIVQHNTANAEKSASISEVMNTRADHLKKFVDELKSLVDGRRTP